MEGTVEDGAVQRTDVECWPMSCLCAVVRRECFGVRSADRLQFEDVDWTVDAVSLCGGEKGSALVYDLRVVCILKTLNGLSKMVRGSLSECRGCSLMCSTEN